MLNTFKRGGVHPDDGKIYAKDKAIETPAVPAQVVIPMSQHLVRLVRRPSKSVTWSRKASLSGRVTHSCMPTSMHLRPAKSSSCAYAAQHDG